MEIGFGYYLIVVVILFMLGMFGIFFNWKNVIVILMLIEFMFFVVNINLVVFFVFLGDFVG